MSTKDLQKAFGKNAELIESPSGTPAEGGAFVHERHLGEPSLHRFEGWWGTDSETRFLMKPVSQPPPAADAWQISTPCALALSPMRAALEQHPIDPLVDLIGGERAFESAQLEHRDRDGWTARLRRLGRRRDRR